VVCRHVSDKSGCAAGEKSLWNTELTGTQYRQACVICVGSERRGHP
jgi:hypothetical protein